MSDSKSKPLPPYIRATSTGFTLQIYVQPNARQTEAVGEHGGALKVQVHAPPVDGKANDELIRWLSEVLEVKKSQITLKRGETQRQKVFEVTGGDSEALIAQALRIFCRP